MSLDRRTFLKALAAATAMIGAGRAPMVCAAGSSVSTLLSAEFAALSASLTGYPVSDPMLTARMFAAFATPTRRAALVQLARLVAATPAADIDAAIRAKGLDVIANDLVAAWYSGIVKTPQGEKLITYTGAMMWSAMIYTKPMGECGGPFGYWANPPQ